MSLPRTMRAIKITDHHTAKVRKVPLPKPREDYVLVKVKSVALNPTDWKHIDKIGKGGETVGVDLCGTILSLPPSPSPSFPIPSTWTPGTRIAAFLHGGNSSQHEDGAYGEYALVKAGLGMRVPEDMSDAEAASLGAGVITCGQALYQSLQLPLPLSRPGSGGGEEDGKEKWLLIYGASTATGTLAIQFARLSGLRVVAICSPRNFDLVKTAGAEAAFDYSDPEACAAKVREYTSDTLELVLDCIAEGTSPSICENCISTDKGGTISYLLKARHSRTDVVNKKTLGYTIMGEAFEKGGGRMEASREDFEHARMFWGVAEKLIWEGKVKPHPVREGKGGLQGILDEGLRELREGRVSGVKLVYRVDDE